MATMQWASSGRVAIVRHTKQPPTDAEWEAYLAAMLEHREVHGTRMVLFVWTAGGGPSMSQRSKANVVVPPDGLPTAVITESMSVRFIVSSMSFFNRSIRAFSPEEIQGAFEHLGLTREERSDTQVTLELLGRSLLGSPSPQRP